MTMISQKLEWSLPLRSEESVQPVGQALGQTDLLINRCLQGESAAYAALYQLYAGYIYRLIYSLLQNREDAEEVLQDSFEYAFRKLSHFDPQKSQFKTWLYRIAVSRSRNKRRRKMLPTFSIQDTQEEGPNTGFDIVDEAAVAPEDRLMTQRRRQIIWAAVGELSDKLRETVILRHYEGLAYQEIGEILGIPAKTAESRMRLAHKALRTSLQELEAQL